MHSTHKNGKVAEFLAAAFFAERGYEIWLPTMTQSRADLVVYKGGIFQTVQVKTACWQRSRIRVNEYLCCTLSKRGKRYASTDFDLLFAIDDAKRIWIVPHTAIAGLGYVCFDSRGPTTQQGYQKQQGCRNKSYNPAEWRADLP